MANLHFLLSENCTEVNEVLKNTASQCSSVFHESFDSFVQATHSSQVSEFYLHDSCLDKIDALSTLAPNARCYILSGSMDMDSLRVSFERSPVCGIINGVTPERISKWAPIFRLAVQGRLAAVDLSVLVGTGAQQEFLLNASSERTPIMDSIEASILENCLEYGEDVAHIFAERAITLADELMLNAIFDANPALKGVDRSCSYELDAKAQVRITCATSPSAFAIGVTDGFGTLQKSDIVSHICNAKILGKISDRVSGGLGLRLSMEGSSGLIFEVAPGKCTRVVLYTHMVPSQRQFRTNPKSVCVFYRY